MPADSAKDANEARATPTSSGNPGATASGDGARPPAADAASAHAAAPATKNRAALARAANCSVGRRGRRRRAGSHLRRPDDRADLQHDFDGRRVRERSRHRGCRPRSRPGNESLCRRQLPREERGSLLVQLDKEPYQIQVALKKAAYENSQANLLVAMDEVRGIARQCAAAIGSSCSMRSRTSTIRWRCCERTSPP